MKNQDKSKTQHLAKKPNRPPGSRGPRELQSGPRRIGRPTECTPELIARFDQYIRAGNYFSTACALCGVSRDSAYKWLATGVRHLNAGNIEDSEYAQFASAVTSAEAFAESTAVVRVRGERSWQSTCWFLERRFPQRWGRQHATDGVGEEAPAKVEIHIHAPDGADMSTPVDVREKLRAAAE